MTVFLLLNENPPKRVNIYSVILSFCAALIEGFQIPQKASVPAFSFSYNSDPTPFL
jgi:hypothetical protein